MTVPFAHHTGIDKLTEDVLTLRNRTEVHNHLGSIHAGALYTLAESQSGLCLQRLFPALEGVVVPLLRDGSMKYRKPVTDAVYAIADVSDEALERFEEMFARKGRGSITVTVVLKDDSDAVCAEGTFHWYVQKVEDRSVQNTEQ